MKQTLAIGLVFWTMNLFLAHADSGPYDGHAFHGRIAFSSDGNFNDEDDWGAFPIAVALLDAFGVTGNLVHVDYNNILTANDPRFYREMSASVRGAAERYGIPDTVLFDCQTNVEDAIASIRDAVNASSDDNPLYYILAGPMEVPYRGIIHSDPAKRQYVYCISHNSWNDGYSKLDQALFTHNKRDVIPSGVNWIQIKDGNPNLAHPGGVGKVSTPEQWQLYHWLRDSKDARLNWIFSRLQSELRCDISDSTMTYFLLTGDEDGVLAKFRRVLDAKELPRPLDPRLIIRLEAENFRVFEGSSVESSNDRGVSKRLCVNLHGEGARIETPFIEPYTAHSSTYEIAVRCLDASGGQGEWHLLVNGQEEGSPWHVPWNQKNWRSSITREVRVSTGDTVAVALRGGEGKLDYIELMKDGHSSPACPVPATP